MSTKSIARLGCMISDSKPQPQERDEEMNLVISFSFNDNVRLACLMILCTLPFFVENLRINGSYELPKRFQGQDLHTPYRIVFIIRKDFTHKLTSSLLFNSCCSMFLYTGALQFSVLQLLMRSVLKKLLVLA